MFLNLCTWYAVFLRSVDLPAFASVLKPRININVCIYIYIIWVIRHDSLQMGRHLSQEVEALSEQRRAVELARVRLHEQQMEVTLQASTAPLKGSSQIPTTYT